MEIRITPLLAALREQKEMKMKQDNYKAVLDYFRFDHNGYGLKWLG